MKRGLFSLLVLVLVPIASALVFLQPAASSSLDDVRGRLSSQPLSGSGSEVSGAGNYVETSDRMRGIVPPGRGRVNVRASAWAEIIGTAYPGLFLEIIGEDGDWYVVDYNGRKGYILKQELETNKDFRSSLKTVGKTGTVKVNSYSTLNVRNGAWGDKIGSLNKGDRVEITGVDGDWYKIKFDGKVGYVYKDYIKKSDNKDSDASDRPSDSNSDNSTQPVASSNNQLINWLQQAGFRGDGLRVAWAIAMRESSGKPDIGPGNQYFNGCDWGLFQLNKPTWGKQSWWDDRKVLDPIYNAKVVFDMSKGGTYWLPWGLTGDGKAMDARCYTMWSSEKQMQWIWKPYKEWYDKYPLK